MHEKDHLLKEYLYKKTKGKLKGKLEDSFLSVLKNWILSHLYGFVVTVSLIAAVVFRITAFAAVPEYVRTVTYEQRPDLIAMTSDNSMQGTSADVQTAEVLETAETENFEEETGIIDNMIGAYTYVYIADTYGEDAEMTLPPFVTRTHMADYAVPASYGYQGVMEYYEQEFPEYFGSINAETRHSEIVFNQPETEIGKRIYADGHPVAETVLTMTHSGTDGTPLGSVSFRFVMTRLEGEWYIAEIREVDA